MLVTRRGCRPANHGLPWLEQKGTFEARVDLFIPQARTPEPREGVRAAQSHTAGRERGAALSQARPVLVEATCPLRLEIGIESVTLLTFTEQLQNACQKPGREQFAGSQTAHVLFVDQRDFGGELSGIGSFPLLRASLRYFHSRPCSC